jgi:2-keto-4-pentenoate hydratase/2-oxohepta-3-ene-1,7-dioic acid hydratase in catechol pathway
LKLFTYLSGAQLRSARLAGKFGIDLNLAAEYFLRSHATSWNMLSGLPTDLDGLLRLWDDGIGLARAATDWIVSSQPQDPRTLPEGILFLYNEFPLAAPVSHPGKVICIAGNYPAMNKIEKPEFPVVFLKPSSGIIGHQQSVILPIVAENVAYEVELAVVIGKKGRNLSIKDALSVIAGYTLANDLGDRVLEKRTSQWTSGKMFDTFTPMGPVLITPDEFGDTGGQKMFTRVNGQLFQKGNTSQMFFNVAELVAYLSTLTTLEPGDVILTGSPKMMDGESNPTCSLKPGDVVEVGIESIFSLINPIVSESQVNDVDL